MMNKCAPLLPQEVICRAEKLNVPQIDGYGAEVLYFADCIEKGADTELMSEESILTVLNSIMKAKESLADNKVKEL